MFRGCLDNWDLILGYVGGKNNRFKIEVSVVIWSNYEKCDHDAKKVIEAWIIEIERVMTPLW